MIDNSSKTLPIPADGPRRVRKKPGRNTRSVLSIVGKIARAVIGTILVFMALMRTSVAVSGVDVHGIVVNRDIESSRSQPIDHLYIAYEYQHQTYTTMNIVNDDAWLKNPPGTTLVVRAWPLAPRMGAIALVDPDAANRSARKWDTYLAVWIAILVYLRLRARSPIRNDAVLLQSGRAVVGTITNVAERMSLKNTFTVEYEYTTDFSPFTGLENSNYGGTAPCKAVDIAPPSVGDPITVVYDPKKPQTSTVYDFSDYEVVAE